jgi:hypothetical protein
MNATLLSLTVVVLLGADGPAKDVPHKASPLAPSLPELTGEEEKELDKLIDRFIDADVCKLKGEEAKKARKEFDKLGSEATFGWSSPRSSAASSSRPRTRTCWTTPGRTSAPASSARATRTPCASCASRVRCARTN